MAQRFDHVLLFYKEMLGIGRADQVLTSENLSIAYGVDLDLAATDDDTLALGDMYGDDKS